MGLKSCQKLRGTRFPTEVADEEAIGGIPRPESCHQEEKNRNTTTMVLLMRRKTTPTMMSTMPSSNKGDGKCC